MTDSAATSNLTTASTDFSDDDGLLTPAAAFSNWISRLRGGDLGIVPAVGGLVLLVIVFGALRPDVFLKPLNVANLLTQTTATALLAIGLTFVLLLGEIDLSAGTAAGVCIVSISSLISHGWNPLVAIALGVALGAFIGAVIGFLVARVGIPSFVVTLALFLAFQGVVLLIVGEGGTISMTNGFIVGIDNGRMSLALGWIFLAVLIVGGLLSQLATKRQRMAAGLGSDSFALIGLRVGGVTVVGAALVGVLSVNRAANASIILQGVPWAVPMVALFVVVLSFLLTRTRWGRHLIAVGGNDEAARRAGINVVRMKISAFMVSGTLAAFAGMALASQLRSVSPQTGANDILLRSVGAAVIGGVSLFGGKGKVVGPVIGALVLSTIDNGLGLLGTVGGVNFSDSGPKYIIAGLILLLASSTDALTRRTK